MGCAATRLRRGGETFTGHKGGIQGQMAKHLDASGWPGDFEAVGLLVRRQPKGHGGGALRQVTAPGAYHAGQLPPCGVQAQACANAVTVAARALRHHAQEVASARRVVAQQVGRALVGRQQQVEVAVVVIVGIGRAAPDDGPGEPGVGLWLQLLEGAVTAIPEQLWPLRVGHVAQVLFIGHMAIDHEEILPAIEVSVEEKQAKGDHAQRRRGDASAVRLLDEDIRVHLTLDTRLAVQCRWLAGKIANGDAELGVIVDIGGIDTHAGIGDSAFIQHQSGLRPEFAKCAIALIDKEQTWA